MKAAPVQGVTMTVYDNWTPDNIYNNAPPVPPVTEIVGQQTVDRVSWNFDYQPVFGLWDDFVVRFDGFLTSPVSGPIRFYVPGDDGVRVVIGDQLIIDDWWDKGGGGSVSDEVQMSAGEPVPFTVWFYENGGGAWLQMWWDTGSGWEEIGGDSFSTIGSWATTTTTSLIPTSSSPTSSSTTTTLPDPPTTTSSSVLPTLTTLTVESTTTMAAPSSSTVSSSSSSLPNSTTVQKTTTTTTTSTTLPSGSTTTTSTITSDGAVTVPEASSSVPSTETAENPQKTNENGETFQRTVKIGPLNITLKATKKQRTTVIAAAIVQMTTVATISTTGVSTGNNTTRRRR